MSKWQMVKLGDVCEPKIETIKSSYDSDMYYIDISSIDNELKEIISYQKINGQNAPSRAKQILKINDILVSTVRPNLNAVAINKISDDIDVIASTGYCILRCKEDILPQYLFSYCKSNDFIDGLVKVAKGASYPAVNNADVKNSKIPLPPLEEQQKIAKNLDLASKLVKLYKTKLQDLDKLIQSVFYDMFGDPVTNEKGWEVKPVIEYCDCMVPGRDKPKSFTGNIPWITIDDLIINGYTSKSKNLLGLTDDEIISVKRKKIPSGSVLMSCVGNLGICSIAEVPLIINQQLHSFQCKSVINNMYLMIYLGFMKPYMSMKASNTTVLYMNKSVCNSIPVMLPPLPLQQKFADIVTKIEEQKAEVNKALKDVEMLYNSLMQEYFE